MRLHRLHEGDEFAEVEVVDRYDGLSAGSESSPAKELGVFGADLAAGLGDTSGGAGGGEGGGDAEGLVVEDYGCGDHWRKRMLVGGLWS